MQQETVHIKKYGNRRLYSSTDTRFVTIEELADFVRSGKTVRVTDAETDEDITPEVLTQILLENGRAQHFPVELLEQMIRMNEHALKSVWASYFDQTKKMFESFEENLRLFQQANPFLRWMEEGAGKKKSSKRSK